ncbi:hypothetical protein DFP81_11419 [Marinomonas pollencensis]|uniref:Uncharacterized protein n=1 Tax=Marinomonas pollencensis TaxID=491954 RepID=A0A3E0DFE7_9GAMM|nr:hypothetical protein DFP81_11419 [Marinomonas pollencensis]
MMQNILVGGLDGSKGQVQWHDIFNEITSSSIVILTDGLGLVGLLALKKERPDIAVTITPIIRGACD